MIEVSHATDDNGCSRYLSDENATLAAGAALAAALRTDSPGETLAPLVIYLYGDLGAGKTTLVRGALRALGYAGKVKSPTYTLIELYNVSRLNLYHFDFYRFTTPEEYLEAGLDEYFSAAGICIVEWPDKAYPYLAAADVEMTLTVEETGRRLKVSAQTEAGKSCTRKLLSELHRTSAG